jgi:lipoprotein-anchoring transpeptidase ErfK/SrfK
LYKGSIWREIIRRSGRVYGQNGLCPPLLPDNRPQAKQKEVLGDQAGDYKRIYVDLTNQRLYAFEGNNLFMNVPVSTGKWNYTPTGEFRIWIWLRYTRMTGGAGAGYYDLPNVPYTMYFYSSSIPKSSGYSLHGAYWHNNFGHPMSHGCVNMRIPDAEKLFYWTNSNVGSLIYSTADNPGTFIKVYGTTPKE